MVLTLKSGYVTLIQLSMTAGMIPCMTEVHSLINEFWVELVLLGQARTDHLDLRTQP